MPSRRAGRLKNIQSGTACGGCERRRRRAWHQVNGSLTDRGSIRCDVTRDDVLEHLELRILICSGLGVGAHGVRDATDDDVRRAPRYADAVHGRNRPGRSWISNGWFPRFLAKPREALAISPGQFVRIAAAMHHPSARAAPSQCCIGVATDQDRDRLGGRQS